ncbi:Gamma-aminobutyric acid (GABA) B receptor [Seminavis robusta]|uniref:Gamma-aminobutyric acid (GABA) B receptor n=1 Tax=Seminavis robusta TaxID=568900 RepID=A0A9N8HIN9_9STRA|nr:Gamma-aminobutyric acid (GABA) B receptor [Seminavis robusta]|eukprot:Sro710_g191100.1 Gamma-aminobutyric acid (GABA) B receptor (1037) ;mRNA; f:28570-31680
MMSLTRSWLLAFLGLVVLFSIESAKGQASNLTVLNLPMVQGDRNNVTHHVPSTTTTSDDDAMTFESWGPCARASFDYIDLTPQDVVEPCILYDTMPPNRTDSNSSFLVTLVQVTPAASSCYSMRDGALVSVELLNAENDGRGVAIGFHRNFYIQFRLVSVIAGNGDYNGTDYYFARHAHVLSTAITALRPQYIIGTCSFFSQPEAQVALQHQTMLLAQVGPPSYYQTGNPYIFGFHLNSDNYPLPAVRALGFSAASKDQPVRVLYRTVAEFFYSTCRSAIDALKELGFTNVMQVEYVPDDDHNGDGIQNQFDPAFLHALADQTCPPNNTQHPAIFACFRSEQDIVLPRWLQNGCRPSSIWLTPATWGWATANPDKIPYMQGGGQWHEAFTYSDAYYASGQDLLVQSEQRFGYFGTYDFVVSYSIPMLFVEHLKNTYRVTDHPDPETDFQTNYEMLRRSMVILDGTTLFGPVSFDDNQRNIGRAPAGTQWLTNSTNLHNKGSALMNHENDNNKSTRQDIVSVYNNYLVSPDFMAQAEIEFPAPSGMDCPPGQFFNESLAMNSSSLLTEKCSQCPTDTVTYEYNQFMKCLPCPTGSTTQGRSGETACYYEDEHLIPDGVRIFGYFMVSVTWALAIFFLSWLIRWRQDPVMQIAQVSFMSLICVGATISSSTIIALSWQAGVGEDTSAATTACRVAPFLYCTGWVLQYGSLTAKTNRLYKITRRNSYERRTITSLESAWIIALILALDLAVVVTWTLVHPLEYRRETTSVAIGEEQGHVVTISSYGRCAPADGSSIWAFAGPIVGIHVILMIVTNLLLYQISDLEDRYQEQKYVALASMYVFQVLVIGLPVLFSVGDSTAAIFLVLSGVIALNDVGILSFLFIPKIHFRSKGLAEGIGIGESLRRSTNRKVQMRELSRQSGLDSNSSHHSSRSCYSAASSRKQQALHLGSTAAESTTDHPVGDRKKPNLDSANFNELKYAILEERCHLLEQQNRELADEIRHLRGSDLPAEEAAPVNVDQTEVSDMSIGSFGDESSGSS